MRVIARSNKSAAAFRSPPFSGAKACIMPAAMAAARKKALAANETKGQERCCACGRSRRGAFVSATRDRRGALDGGRRRRRWRG
eukprot:4693246-Pleurochrysis_carterae.AAC.2